MAGAAVLAGQLFTGWANDLHDAALDRAQGRKDKPIATGELKARTAKVAIAAALLATIPLSLANGPWAAAVHGVALAAAAAYNLRLKTTKASPLPYALAFALLPCFVTLGIPGDPRWPHAWAPIAGALLGAGAHFTQSLPDVQREHEEGLPAILGGTKSALLAAALMAAAAVVIAFGPGRPDAIDEVGVAAAVITAAAVVPAAATGHPKAAFRLTLAVAAIALAGFLAGGRVL